MKRILILFSVVSIVSCSSPQNQRTAPAAANYPVKPLEREDDTLSADIRLSISNISENDTAKLYKAVSTWQGKELGFLVMVPKREERGGGFGSGIVLKSLGPQSDYLLKTLAGFYKQKPDTALHFTTSTSVNYVNLGGLAKSLGAGNANHSATVEYKLFFEGRQKDDYAELYLNINSDEQWVELKEKDPEYRPMIIKLLGV